MSLLWPVLFGVSAFVLSFVVGLLLFHELRLYRRTHRRRGGFVDLTRKENR